MITEDAYVANIIQALKDEHVAWIRFEEARKAFAETSKAHREAQDEVSKAQSDFQAHLLERAKT